MALSRWLNNVPARFAVAGLLLASPWLVWSALPTRPLGVLIVDKTVAKIGYREHKGLMWALNHAKVTPRGGPGPFRYDQHYVGFYPAANHTYREQALPKTPGAFDLIYLADTYGVYAEDFYGDNKRGQHSPLMSGGLQQADIDAVETSLKPGGTLIAEFNTFASPTRAAERERFTRLMGLAWHGWIGRYFTDLRRGGEVPDWLVSNFERRKNRPYTYEGPGYTFINDDGRVEVLRQREDAGDDFLKIYFKQGLADTYGVYDETRYDYWFDVVTPREGTEVLAEYRVDLTDSGKAILAAAGLPSVFPAVLRKRDARATRYYFAGDYADEDEVPARWQLFGMDWAYKVSSFAESPNGFYWRVYVPLLRALVSETPAQ